MAFIKHIGTHKGTNQRLCVAFLRLPDEPENALVVYSDSLPDKYHDDFMSAIESPEGQSSKELYEVLTRKLFWHGATMLDTLHTEGLLVKMPTSSIIMTPNGQTSIPLDELIKKMGDIETNTVTEDPTQVDPGTRIKDNVDATLGEDNKMIAQNLLQQAILLEEEAVKKRAEAVKFDPSLLEKASKPAKKGRGRPAGTTAKAMAARSADANVDA
tara:strand:- start:113 stop:754 length:642 start_codon:yes stop_codon:yes gene_type:complete